MTHQVIQGDNLSVMRGMESETFDLIYIDPPFNTGKQRRGMRGSKASYGDRFEDFRSFIEPRIAEMWRLLNNKGSFFLHLDYREVHYAKVICDLVFGRESFMNEIIWAYDYGGRSKKKWPCKHDNILWYAADPSNYTFNYEEMDRIPYMAPGLAGKEKAARGKTPTDVWWHTIVPTNGSERTGYPTQKPLGVLERIIKVHSNPGDMVGDFFCGSGTTAVAAKNNGRHSTSVDLSKEAVKLASSRLYK